MRSTHLFTGALAAGLLAAGASASAQAVVFTANFETDQSATFTVRNADVTPGANDFVANFQYDYSTHTQTQPPATVSVPILQSPNSGLSDGTRGLRLESNNNDATSEESNVTVFPNVSPLENWTMTFDLWMNYNGDAGGAVGSTEVITWGGAANTTLPVTTVGGTAVNGWHVTMTGEGGAGQDYRYYDGTGPIVRDDAVPPWHGAATVNINNTAQPWQDFFPVAASPPQSTAQTAGSPGMRWVVVKTVVTNASTTPAASIYLTDPAGVSSTETLVAQFDIKTAGTSSVQPFIGYWDLFGGSIATPAADNFAVIDNIEITDDTTTSVNNWSVYN